MQHLFLTFLAVLATTAVAPDQTLTTTSAATATLQNHLDFEVVVETPDKSKGEHARSRTVHKPSGVTVTRDVYYDNGRRHVRQNFRYGIDPRIDGMLETEQEFQPHPRLAVMQLRREAHYSLDGKRKLSETFYRADGTLERIDLYKNNALVQRTVYAADGATVVSRTSYDKDGRVIPQP